MLHLQRPQRNWSSGRYPRPRMRWVPTVRLVALLGIGAALIVTHALEINVFPRWGGSPRAISEPQIGRVSGLAKFTLCDGSNRRNCVIDGDTIRYGEMKIRLADIDAPEIHDYKCTSELDLGRRARDRLLELVNSGPFQIVDKGGHDADRYGRKLRAVERDGRSFGDVLISEGLARRWDGARRSWCSA
jgi:micrococcal nuclease